MGGKFGNRNKSKPPVERLDRSHRRLEERLAELVSCAALIAEGKDLAASWEAAKDVLAYLERAGVRHEEDEEETVFPRLAAFATLRPLLKDLRAEHRSQRKHIGELAKLVKAPKQAGASSKLSRVAAKLEESYTAHIRREDKELLPAIKRHLGDSTAEMAAEMAARRS